MRLDLVIRTSHRKQDALSPRQQRELAANAAKRGGHTIVATHDSGRSESGKTMDRAALRDVRERVRADETDGVLVGYLDRLGRAPIEESMTFVRELIGDGGALVAADWSFEPIDLSDPNVEDMLVFRLQMNRSMWNKASERHRLNKRDALKAGKFIGPAPFGYDKLDGRLVAHPTEAPIVREAFRRAARDGVDAARDYLQRVAPDARHWRMDMVRHLIKSRTYLGEHATRGLVAGVDDNGETIPYKQHDALVDLDTWTAAQHAPRPRRANSEYLLTQLVYCECGAHLIGQWQLDKTRRYRCARGHSCCAAALLDDFVRDELRDVLGRDEIRERVLPTGVDDARERFERAQADRRRYQLATASFASDGWAEGAALVEQRVADAHDVYRQLVSQAAQSDDLPAAEQLDDDDELQRGLRILASRGLRFVVARGRGALADRVALDDLEAVAGALAA